MQNLRTIGMTADSMRGRRRFAAVQAAKALLGVCLACSYVILIGYPGIWAALAGVGLCIPAALAVLALAGVSLAALETISLASLAVLVGYLALLTGGMRSPLLIWFVLVPAEAALAGGHRSVWRAALVAAVALLVVVIVEVGGVLPLVLMGYPAWQVYPAAALAAIVQSAMLTIASQDRQREADRAAAEGAAMYRFLADNAMDLITRHSTDGRIRFASPASQTLLAIPPEALVGHAPSTLVHPDDLKTMQAAFVEASYFGHAATAEVRLKRADGGYVWTEMRCRPATQSDGKAADIVAVTRDISERKAQELALIDARDLAEQASRAKSHFLANMSHELRTPLNAIIGFSEVMTHEMFGPLGAARYNEYASLIHESGGHLLELINGILDMSKIEAGKFELSEEIFDLEDVATQALRFVKLQADRKGVALKINVAPSAKTIFADRRAITQMLVNLITNGVKFTPRGGEVTVKCARADGGVEIAVADSGVGIAEKDLVRLGRPFEQVDGAHVRAQEGTGLGLALVKALAQMHGGEALLESTLGVGTTVRLRLPHAAVSESGDSVEPEHLQEKAQALRGAA
jgi:two-component system, cell cycle sensor histidine kinase DivJ